MKRTLLVTTLGGLLAFGAISGSAVAQAAAKVEKETPQTTADQSTAKPAKKKTTKKAAAADQANEKSDLKVKDQPVGPEPAGTVPTGEVALGSVRIPKAVTADGKPLAAGTYTVKLTAKEADPPAAGQTPTLERWVEFTQGGQTKGREIVTIIPSSEVQRVVKEPPPGASHAKVETLKGGDYLRVWIAKGGNHFLVHLPIKA
jgi:hypothetical protein